MGIHFHMKICSVHCISTTETYTGMVGDHCQGGKLRLNSKYSLFT